jgi:hypothetical protein
MFVRRGSGEETGRNLLLRQLPSEVEGPRKVLLPMLTLLFLKALIYLVNIGSRSINVKILT